MHNMFRPVRTLGLRRFWMLFCALFCIPALPSSVDAQSIPKERRITHREQSFSIYNPFEANELWERIPIPPAPALSPEEALKSFKLASGFRIECVAAEPLVVDPVMFEFDADGRIWAVEMRGWMNDINGTGEGDPTGQVVVLEDTDGDSIMDKSTVFLDKLVMPRTVSFVAGGVLVAEPPNLWYCRDTNGDLKCDSKELVGNYGRPGNPEHTENSLYHVIDNWMYSAKSATRHRFRNGKLIEDATAFRGQWGMSQDDYGRLYYDYENSSLHCDLFPSTYAMRNPHVRRLHGCLNVNVAREAHEVFPIRVTPGITLGATELREDGTLRTFTIACGPSIYRGDQFPEEYYGGAVIPEAGGNLVRFDFLDSDGAHIKARNAFGKHEWLASTDERFRPVWSRTGPDGAVYIADLYHGIIEHVIFMMPYLRNQIISRGLESPDGLGRIYRISHEDKPLGRIPQMSQEDSIELVEHLSHPNGWWRDTAQRLIVERNAIEVTDRLRKVATKGPVAVGRVHALWTLEGIGKLDWRTVHSAIADDDAMVRATAIRLSEHVGDRPTRDEVFRYLEQFFSDDRPMVQLQVMLSLGSLMTEPAREATEKTSHSDLSLNDAILQQMAAILIARPSELFSIAAASGLEGWELEMLALLSEHDDWSSTAEQQTETLQTLAMAVINEGDPTRVGRLLELASTNMHDSPWIAEAIVDGIRQSNLAESRWPEPIQLVKHPRLLSDLEQSSRPELQQSAAPLLRILTWPGDTTERMTKPVLRPLTSDEQRQYNLGRSVYSATCFSCHKENGRGQFGQAPPLVDSEWVNGDPEHLVRIVLHGIAGPIQVNNQTWDSKMPPLGYSPILNNERLASVLTYVRRAWGNYGDPVAPDLVSKIRQATSGRTAMWSAEELLNPSSASTTTASEEQDPLAQYRDLLDGGDARSGEALFHDNRKIRCNACHVISDMGGGFVGPNLTKIGAQRSKSQLLESIVDPSRKITEGYETLVLITNSGDIISGTFVSDDGKEVVISPPTGGKVTVPADEIDERLDSPVSTMPPMGTIFTPQEIADLVAYLISLDGKNSPERKALGKDENPSIGE